MAEKYGTLPEKFTKAWWEHYWEYYKWFVIVPLVLLIILVASIYSKLTAPKYDLNLTYAANNFISPENEERITKNLSELCDDIDQNGEKSLFFSQLFIQSNPSQENLEYVMGATNKLQLSFSADEKYIYILDKEVISMFIGATPEESPFAPVDNWAQNLPEGTEFFTEHGINYGVSLSGNKILEDCGIDLSDHYVLIRYYPRKDQIKKQLEGYKAAINLANRIISNKESIK